MNLTLYKLLFRRNDPHIYSRSAILIPHTSCIGRHNIRYAVAQNPCRDCNAELFSYLYAVDRKTRRTTTGVACITLDMLARYAENAAKFSLSAECFGRYFV